MSLATTCPCAPTCWAARSVCRRRRRGRAPAHRRRHPPSPASPPWQAPSTQRRSLPSAPTRGRRLPTGYGPRPSAAACPGGLASLLLRLADEPGHRLTGLIALAREAVADTHPVLGGAVLARLPLPDEASYRHLEPDDGAELGLDVLGRGVGDLPRLAARRLVAVREDLDESPEPRAVVDEA